MEDIANLKIDKSTRQRLKVYCAENDLTYDEAIQRLLDEKEILKGFGSIEDGEAFREAVEQYREEFDNDLSRRLEEIEEVLGDDRDGDALEELREAVGGAFEDKSIDELRAEAQALARREAERDAQSKPESDDR